MARATLAVLFAAAVLVAAAAALPSKDAILGDALKAFDYYVKARANGTHPECGWEYGTFMVGTRELEHALRARGSGAVLDKARGGAAGAKRGPASGATKYAGDVARLNEWAMSFGDKYNWEFCGSNLVNADNQVRLAGGGRSVRGLACRRRRPAGLSAHCQQPSKPRRCCSCGRGSAGAAAAASAAAAAAAATASAANARACPSRGQPDVPYANPATSYSCLEPTAPCFTGQL